MILGNYYDGLELVRKEKIVYGHFLKPHRVLSACRANGGVREDLAYLFNHQSCEPAKHVGTDLCEVAVNDPQRYLKRIMRKAGLEDGAAAGLGTAANMRNAVISRQVFQDLEVIAVTTAGVGGNAGCAGDPASYTRTVEGTQILERPMPYGGTIVTLVFINEELTPGALVVAATVVAESKAGLLRDLMVPSKYSTRLATGTGTDQVGIAALIGTPVIHGDANKHSKLGELIGRATEESLREALNLQGGVSIDWRRSSLVQLARFGETKAAFIHAVRERLPESCRDLFEANFLSVNHDPVTVGSVQALIHLRDQSILGVLPQGSIQEMLLLQGALIARTVAGKPIELEALMEDWSTDGVIDSCPSFLNFVREAFARGFALKWNGRFED